MKYLTEAIREFLADLDREGMGLPVAIILTPKEFKRVCDEMGQAVAPAIELVTTGGSVYLQAGMIQRVEKTPLRSVPAVE